LELEATYPEGFGFLNGIRELRDGRVLAADPLAEVLLRIHPAWASADTLGQVGPGPGEYLQPDGVLPLPGDSSLLVDLGKMQLTGITPDGAIGSGHSMSVTGEGASPLVFQPRFADETGALYDQASRSRESGPPDSAAILRLDRVAWKLDTVATVWLPEARLTRSRSGGFLPAMLEPMDGWAVGADGRIAVVRASGFSVEWVLPDGRVLKGPAYEFPDYPVRRRDKEAILAENRSSGISMTMATSRDGSVRRMTMRRGLPSAADAPGVDDFQWAESFPPFHADGVLVAPGNEVWVERWLPPEADSRWECFDDHGVWLGSVVLPPGHRLVGFGHGPDDGEVAFLTRTDAFDLKWLERYRIVR